MDIPRTCSRRSLISNVTDPTSVKNKMGRLFVVRSRTAAFTSVSVLRDPAQPLMSLYLAEDSTISRC